VIGGGGGRGKKERGAPLAWGTSGKISLQQRDRHFRKKGNYLARGTSGKTSLQQRDRNFRKKGNYVGQNDVEASSCTYNGKFQQLVH
jgi:hypothetical protein